MPNVIDLLVAAKSEKAWSGGGGRGKGPGSRGGKFWVNQGGHVEYGAKPSGARGRAGGTATAKPKPRPQAQPQRAVSTGHGGGSGKPRVGELRAGYRIKPQTAAGKLASHKKMLSEMDKAISTGKDPHGNKLSQASIDKLRLLATGLRTEIKPVGKAKTVGLEVKAQIAEKASAHMPFTVFKDAKGQWRWIGVSSSAAKDADGETVSRKALQADTAMKDVTRDYGPLNWWHTPIQLGACDFNAMDGPLLVESGTFINEGVARAVAKAIADGNLNPGMSLEFEHNEPGPPVLPGRVFTRINKVGRALLPAEKASNLLTSFKVYSLKSAASAGESEKESKKMLTEEKYKKLESILPHDLLEGLLSGNEVAVKSAELAGYSFKAMTPPMGKSVVNAAQTPVPPADTTPLALATATAAPKKKLDTKAGPMDNMSGLVAEGSPEEEAAESPEEEAAEQEGGYEDSPADDAADAIMQSLYDQIDQIVQSRLEAASKDILAALSGVSAAATASKEVNDLLAAQTLALKENTTALNTVVAENKSLKARLDALEGVQPAAVRARATQSGGVSAAELPPAHQDLVNPAQKEVDPYAKIVEQLGLTMAPRG